jgi:hypothetical protein
VLAELQGSDTVNYLATLESRLQAKDELIATQAKRLNALKVRMPQLARLMLSILKNEYAKDIYYFLKAWLI